jgi:hypothetical protein
VHLIFFWIKVCLWVYTFKSLKWEPALDAHTGSQKTYLSNQVVTRQYLTFTDYIIKWLCTRHYSSYIMTFCCSKMQCNFYLTIYLPFLYIILVEVHVMSKNVKFQSNFLYVVYSHLNPYMKREEVPVLQLFRCHWGKYASHISYFLSLFQKYCICIIRITLHLNKMSHVGRLFYLKTVFALIFD